jgi:hypothetical protein
LIGGEKWRKPREAAYGLVKLIALTPYFCPRIGLSLVENGTGDAPNFAQKSAHRFLA